MIKVPRDVLLSSSLHYSRATCAVWATILHHWSPRTIAMYLRACPPSVFLHPIEADGLVPALRLADPILTDPIELSRWNASSTATVLPSAPS